jgi:hypothetical protein
VVSATSTDERLSDLREALDAARAAWSSEGEVFLETGLSYGDGQPVVVFVRKRGRNYDIDDRGAAAQKAGKPRGWLEVARGVVREDWLNVNRAGVVFVGSFEGRDVASLALRIGDCSLAVYGALLEYRDDH